MLDFYLLLFQVSGSPITTNKWQGVYSLLLFFKSKFLYSKNQIHQLLLTLKEKLKNKLL